MATETKPTAEEIAVAFDKATVLDALQLAAERVSLPRAREAVA